MSDTRDSRAVLATAETNTWVARGVSQAIVQRLLVSVCHDLAGHLSVTRMIALMLNKQLDKPEPAIPSLQNSATSLGQEVNRALQALRLVRSFAEPDEPCLSADDCVAQVVTLLKAPARLAGHQLTAIESTEAAQATPPRLPLTVLLAVAGLAFRAMERADGPCEIRVARHGHAFEVSHARLPDDASAQPLAMDPSWPPLSTTPAFDLFVSHCGFQLTESAGRQQIAPRTSWASGEPQCLPT